MQKANKLKEVKAEKRTSMKKNTRSKEENQHEEEYSIKRSRRRKARTMSKLHPQHFLFRPPVVGLDMYWNLYRKDWEEKYYFVYMEDVGLQHDLGLSPSCLFGYLTIHASRSHIIRSRFMANKVSL